MKITTIGNFSIFSKQKMKLILILVFSLLSSATTVLAPFVVGSIIDQLANSFPFSSFVFLISLYLTLFVSNTILAFLIANLVAKLSYQVRKKLFGKLSFLPFSFLDQAPYGEVINHFSVDVDMIVNGITQSVSRITIGISTILLATYLMFTMHVTMTILLVACAPFMYLASYFITKRTKELFKKRAKLVGILNSHAEEILTNQKLIKDYAYEEQAYQEFRKYNEQLNQVGQKAQFYSSLTNPSIRLISNLSYILIGITGIFFASKGQLSVGNISTFLLLTSVFTRPFNEITSVLSEIQTSLASYSRIKLFVQKKEEPKQLTTSSLSKIQGKIDFQHVSFSYQKEKPVLNDITFSLHPGETVAIVGKTGSGKTTLVNLLMRFYSPEQGTILLDGKNIQNVSKCSLRKQIGMVLQDTKLFVGTVKENISYGNPDATEEEIIQASKLAHADSFIRRLPQGYDTYLSHEGMLSSGEVQLLTIARVFLMHPPIVILDEATSNVDFITEANIQKAFSTLIDESTSILIAHRLSTILQADRIFFLENGRIIEEGTHPELIAKKGSYFKLYESQFQ